MLIRNELFNRAIKQDKIAQKILSAISTSKTEQAVLKETIAKTVPQTVPITHIVSVKVKIPVEKANAVSFSFVKTLAQNTTFTSYLSQLTNLPQANIQSIFNSYVQNISQPIKKVVDTIASQTGVEKEKVVKTIASIREVISRSKLINNIAQKEKITEDQGEKIISLIPQVVEKGEETKPISSTLSPQVNLPEEKVNTFIQSVFTSIKTDNKFIDQIANQVNLPSYQTKTILHIFTQNINQPTTSFIKNIASQTGVKDELIHQTLNKTTEEISKSRSFYHEIIEKVGRDENLEPKAKGQFTEEDKMQTINLSKPAKGRYFCFEALSSYNNSSSAAIAELDIFNFEGKSISHQNWSVAYVSSEELIKENGGAENAIDGQTFNYWHSQWSSKQPGYPHYIVIDLGKEENVTGFGYVPVAEGSKGRIKDFQVFIGNDIVTRE